MMTSSTHHSRLPAGLERPSIPSSVPSVVIGSSTEPPSSRQNRRHSRHFVFSSGRPSSPTPQTTEEPGTQTDPISARKSRTPRDVAKRLFEQATLSSSSSSRASRRRTVNFPLRSSSPSPPEMQHPVVMGRGVSGIPSHRAEPYRVSSSLSNSTTSSGMSSASAASSAASLSVPSRPLPRRRSSTVGTIMPLQLNEKPQASSSGGAVVMHIQLAEPMLFLQGLEGTEQTRRPAMLRGSMVVRINKPTKIKAITLTFRGRARTEWPEGIPPKKSEYFEEKEIMQHTWPFFNAQFTTAELGHGADAFHPRAVQTSPADGNTIISSAMSHLSWSPTPSLAEHKMGMRITQSRSFSRGESPHRHISVAQRGYRIFQPGDYAYNFELPLDSCLPETINVDLGTVKYELEGTIERPGAFRPNLIGKKEVLLVRVPSESNLEQTEPIAISRTWEDQLHYDIVISGKAFPLGSTIPIAFKLTPLAKVRCHRIRIYITENVEYACKNKKVHRLDPVKKVQLFEKRAESHATSAFSGSSVRVVSGGGLNSSQEGGHEDLINGSDNLLGDLNGSPNVGPTEMEFNVQLPGCNAKDRERIHFDTTYGNIQVHHWIKIVMRLSKQDPQDPNKRRHFEISIDSPFHILSCHSSLANTTLPAYGAPTSSAQAQLGRCSCPINPCRRSQIQGHGSSTNLTSQANSSTPSLSYQSALERPIHLIRYPSTNPPPFEADAPPPPFLTPPPRYESIVHSTEQLAGYFASFGDGSTPTPPPEDEDTDEEEVLARGRLLLPPLTPGGRVARSLDERRTWGTVGSVEG